MDMVSHVVECIQLADQKKSKLTEEIALWYDHNPDEGMSTPRTRHFFNNLLDRNLAAKHGISNINYLEVGTWKGSTAVPALYKNDVDNYWLVDNFSQFSGGTLGNPHDRLLHNFDTYLNTTPNLIQNDSFAVNFAEHNIRDVNFYFYDGEHSAASQHEAITYYIDAMADEFVLVVDDFDRPNVQRGTQNGLEELIADKKIEVVHNQYVTSNSPVIPGPDVESWYCGLFIAVIKKI